MRVTSTTLLVSSPSVPPPSALTLSGNSPLAGTQRVLSPISILRKSLPPIATHSTRDFLKLCRRWESACSPVTTAANSLKPSVSDPISSAIIFLALPRKSGASPWLNSPQKPFVATPKATPLPPPSPIACPMQDFIVGAETGKFTPSPRPPFKPYKLLSDSKGPTRKTSPPNTPPTSMLSPKILPLPFAIFFA